MYALGRPAPPPAHRADTSDTGLIRRISSISQTHFSDTVSFPFHLSPWYDMSSPAAASAPSRSTAAPRASSAALLAAACAARSQRWPLHAHAAPPNAAPCNNTHAHPRRAHLSSGERQTHETNTRRRQLHRLATPHRPALTPPVHSTACRARSAGGPPLLTEDDFVVSAAAQGRMASVQHGARPLAHGSCACGGMTPLQSLCSDPGQPRQEEKPQLRLPAV